ncbi:MAG: hypothetical protein K2N91_08335, partial [Muribaculaceae bacterium]|nr:hypothetical protein [Muribaculaceae bacterium]
TEIRPKPAPAPQQHAPRVESKTDMPLPAPPPPTGRAMRQRSLQSTRQRVESHIAASQSETSTEQANRTGRYTDEQLQQAWDAFASAHATEHVLVNAMRTCRPKRLNDNNFIIAVVNEIQLSEFNKAHGELRKFIHDNLGNDLINFTFTITDEGPSPTVWNDRELFSHILEDPKAAAFINTLKLKLS